METQQQWKRKTDRFLDVWRCLRRNKAAMTGLIVILIFVLLAVFAGVICDYDMVIKPVSYTHLDVYKRQILTPSCQKPTVSILAMISQLRQTRGVLFTPFAGSPKTHN